jgi:predicted alpha/beta-fold hydrolase
LLLPDGGTIALDWARKGNVFDDSQLPLDAPVVILHHGLVGDSQSEYIYHMSWTLLCAGYRVVVMVARGCGGLELTSGEIFAGRRTTDVANCVDRVKHLHPQSKVFWVGFSLGAALTLQYLAAPHANTQVAEDIYATYGYPSDKWTGPLTAAVCVSPPWDVAMNSCNPSYIAYFWMSLVVIPLKMYYVNHRSYLNKVAPETIGGISLWKLFWTRSMADFDELMYPTHRKTDGGKYATLREYYDDISPVHCAELVQTPTIVLTAKDDPLCMHKHAPTDPGKIGPGLVVVSG